MALNENIIYKRSTLSNFRNSILDTDIYFSNKKIYNMNNPSLSKSLIYYAKNSNYIDNKTKKVKLINLHKIKEIYNTYVTIVKNNGLEMHDGIINEDYIYSEDESDIEEKSISESSNESDEKEDINCGNIPDKKDKDPSDDDEGDNKEENTDILDFTKKCKSNKNKNNKKTKSYTKSKNKKNNKNDNKKNNLLNDDKIYKNKRNYIDMMAQQKKIFGYFDYDTNISTKAKRVINDNEK